MLQFKNDTPFVGALNLFPDANGVDTLFAVVKGTFSLGPRLALADEQLPLTTAPEYHGEPATSSIKLPSDVSLAKPATDVILLGCARTPNERPATQLDVTVTVGPVTKTVRVFGDRAWRHNGATYEMTSAQPFQTVPLVWERAYGGTDAVAGVPRVHDWNPVGTGYRATDGDGALDDLMAPNVEDPGDLITSWKQHPAPAGVAPIASHWEPRRSYAGTYDERWERTRAPYLPTDFDSRHCQISASGLTAPGELRGGEPIELVGVSHAGAIHSRLPGVRLRVHYRLDSTLHERPAMLDTVVIEPDALRVSLVWRAAFQCDKTALRISEVSATLVGSI